MSKRQPYIKQPDEPMWAGKCTIEGRECARCSDIATRSVEISHNLMNHFCKTHFSSQYEWVSSTEVMRIPPTPDQETPSHSKVATLVMSALWWAAYDDMESCNNNERKITRKSVATRVRFMLRNQLSLSTILDLAEEYASERVQGEVTVDDVWVDEAQTTPDLDTKPDGNEWLPLEVVDANPGTMAVDDYGSVIKAIPKLDTDSKWLSDKDVQVTYRITRDVVNESIPLDVDEWELMDPVPSYGFAESMVKQLQKKVHADEGPGVISEMLLCIRILAARLAQMEDKP